MEVRDPGAGMKGKRLGALEGPEGRPDRLRGRDEGAASTALALHRLRAPFRALVDRHALDAGDDAIQAAGSGDPGEEAPPPPAPGDRGRPEDAAQAERRMREELVEPLGCRLVAREVGGDAKETRGEEIPCRLSKKPRGRDAGAGQRLLERGP